MPTYVYRDLEDPRVRPYLDLRRRRHAESAGLFVVEGRLMVERLLASDFLIHSLLVDPQYAEEFAARYPGVDLFVPESGRAKDLVGYDFHRGVLACGYRKDASVWESALPPRERPSLVVLLPMTQDPENVGGIVRSTAALGGDAVFLGKQSADPFSRRSLRVSMGTGLKLPVFQHDDALATARRLGSEHGYSLVGAALDSRAIELSDFRKRPARIALCLGNEAAGLDSDWLDACDTLLRLDMERQTDSLNVSVAAGVFLYALQRRCEIE
ncbi:MAG TPA: RNA methyltransferase [Pirellulaceae bacterium]|jgi:tRNA G18 (ribose-2'-O)-methylase SpoU|nr:RNA methyltransferase [Pirellulaceae bacterium]